MMISNNKGGITIVLLVMLSSVFVVMMGIAGVKLLDATKNLKKHNEAYNYLLAMEELGQSVGRARSTGRNTECLAHTVTPATANPTAAMYQAACPANTRHLWVAAPVPKTLCPAHPRPALRIQNRYALCVPDRNGNATVDAVEFCAQIEGFNYCLSGGPFNQNLRRIDLNDENTTVYLGRPSDFLLEPAGSPSQQTNGATLLPRNNAETWNPSVAWADTNEMYTSTCGAYAAANNERYWLGCHFCDDPNNECWLMRMCPRSLGIPGAGACASGDPPAQQRIVLYFENNRTN